MSHPRKFDSLPGRILTVNGIRWKWVYGNKIVARSEDDRRLIDWISIVKGLPNHVIERGHENRTSDGSIFPSEVAAWIKRESNWVKLSE